MASYNELLALIDAYINRNGVQAITGQILNGVLKAMVDQLGRGYTLMGYAEPTGDPGTPDGPESWFASVPGTYTNYGEIQVAAGELALLSFAPSEGWTKNTIYEGFREVTATADDNIGFPQVGVTYANGVLSFDFKNIKGEPGENGQDGDPAGFGAVTASVDDQVGTPSVSVSSSGPDTAKVFSFAFHNLKGETGVTSVVATVDNTSGNPQCSVSLQGGQLTLAFTGLKGAQGDTGSSVDYPFTIVNNLTTNDPAQALSAAMGVQLESEVSQLEAKVDDISTGKYYGYFATSADLPDDATVDGFAYVGSGPTYTIYNCVGGVWTSSDVTVNQSPIGNEEDIDQNEDGKLQFADRVYNSAQPNGMGYKILRKDATFSSQVTDTNTIYEIRYDFNLGGASKTIPANCELRFNGGSINNGAIVYNQTIVSGAYFGNINVTASGTVKGSATPQMFGAKGDAVTDDTASFLAALNSGTDVTVPGSEYLLSQELVMPNGTCLHGDREKTILTCVGITVGSRCALHSMRLKSYSSTIDHLVMATNDNVSYKRAKVYDLSLTGTSDDSSTTAAIVLECTSSGIRSGYHTVSFRDIEADGFFQYGIVFRFVYEEDIYLWITDVEFNNCFFYATKICIGQIVSGQHSDNNVYLGGINFNEVRCQYNANFSERFASMEYCSTARFFGCTMWDGTTTARKFILSKKCTGITIYGLADSTVDLVELQDIESGESLERLLIEKNIISIRRQGPVYGEPLRIPGMSGNASLEVGLPASVAASVNIVELTGVKDYTGTTQSGHAIVFRNSKSMSLSIEARIIFINTSGVIYTANYKSGQTEITLYPLVGNLQTFRKSTANLPSAWSNLGSQIFDTTRLGPVWSNGNGAWVDGTGTSVTARRTGTTAQRPTTGIKDGFAYLDTTLNKMVWHIGGSWYDASGASV